MCSPRPDSGNVRLSVLRQNHRQEWFWDDLVHAFADHCFPAQSGDLQESRVYRREAELTFRFDSQLENDISNSVVDRGQLLFVFAQRSFSLLALGDVPNCCREVPLSAQHESVGAERGVELFSALLPSHRFESSLEIAECWKLNWCCP